MQTSELKLKNSNLDKSKWRLTLSICLLIILSVVLQSCSSPVSNTLENDISIYPTAELNDAPTEIVKEINPIQTPTPSIMINNEVDPPLTPTSTPVQFWPSKLITTENVIQLSLLKSVGRGTVNEIMFVQDSTRLIVKTKEAVFVYAVESFKDVIFAPDTYAYAVSPDETHLLTSHPNGLVKYWDLNTGELIDEFQRIPEIYRYHEPMDDPSIAYKESWAPKGGAIAFIPDGSGFAYSSHDGGITVWKFGQNEPESVYIDDILNSIAVELAISPNGETIAVLTGSKYFLPERQPGYYYNNSRLIFIDNQEKKIVNYQRDPGGLMTPAFSPDGKYLLTSIKQNLYLWDAVTGASAGHFGVNLDQPYSAEFNQSGDEITLTGTMQGTFAKHIQKFPQGNLISKIDVAKPINNFDLISNNLSNVGHYSNIVGIQASQNGVITLWDAEYWVDLETGLISKMNSTTTAQVSYTPEEHGQAWCSDGTFHYSSEPKLIDIPIPAIAECKNSIAFPSQSLAAILTPYRFALLDLKGGTLQEITGFQKPIEWVTLSADGSTMATGSYVPNHDNAQLIFWSLSPLKRLIETDHLDSKPFKYMKFSQDNNFLYSLGSRARKWRVVDGENIIIYPIENPSAMALSPKEDLVAVSEYSGLVHVYTSDSAEEIYTIEGHKNPILMTFNNTQTALMVVDGNGITRIYGVK